MYIKDKQSQKINIFTLLVQYLEKHSNTTKHLAFRGTRIHIFEGSYVGDALYHFLPLFFTEATTCIHMYI